MYPHKEVTPVINRLNCMLTPQRVPPLPGHQYNESAGVPNISLCTRVLFFVFISLSLHVCEQAKLEIMFGTHHRLAIYLTNPVPCDHVINNLFQ